MEEGRTREGREDVGGGMGRERKGRGHQTRGGELLEGVHRLQTLAKTEAVAGYDCPGRVHAFERVHGLPWTREPGTTQPGSGGSRLKMCPREAGRQCEWVSEYLSGKYC